MALGDETWEATLRAERKAKAWELRLKGNSLRAVAAELGCSAQHVHDLIREEIKELKPATEDVEAIRLQEDARLSAALEKAFEVLENTHYAHSGGALILGPNGAYLYDDKPALSAVDRIRSLSESRRKLWGVDAPERLDVTNTEVPLSDAVQERLEAARRAVAEREAGMRDGP